MGDPDGGAGRARQDEASPSRRSPSNRCKLEVYDRDTDHPWSKVQDHLASSGLMASDGARAGSVRPSSPSGRPPSPSELSHSYPSSPIASSNPSQFSPRMPLSIEAALDRPRTGRFDDVRRLTDNLLLLLLLDDQLRLCSLARVNPARGVHERRRTDAGQGVPGDELHRLLVRGHWLRQDAHDARCCELVQGDGHHPKNHRSPLPQAEETQEE